MSPNKFIFIIWSIPTLFEKLNIKKLLVFSNKFFCSVFYYFDFQGRKRCSTNALWQKKHSYNIYKYCMLRLREFLFYLSYEAKNPIILLVLNTAFQIQISDFKNSFLRVLYYISILMYTHTQRRFPCFESLSQRFRILINSLGSLLMQCEIWRLYDGLCRIKWFLMFKI